MLSNLCADVSIGSNMTFAQLIARQQFTVFTNWYDGDNFPNIYGSGIFIPTLDNRMKYILYCVGNILYLGNYSGTTGKITWTRLEQSPHTHIYSECGLIYETGVITVPSLTANGTAEFTANFSSKFSSPPMVTTAIASSGYNIIVQVLSISTSSVSFRVTNMGGACTNRQIQWKALGL